VNLFLKTFLPLLFFSQLFSSQALAFQKAEAGAFVFFYNKQDEKTAEILISNAGLIADRLSESLGFKFQGKTRVIVVSTQKEFQRVQPRGARIPSWAIGVAYPAKKLIVLLKKPRCDIVKVFRHELTHVLLGRAFSGEANVPRWLDEGLAMIQADEWNPSRLSTITSAVLTDSLLSMDSIAESFPRDPKDAELAYCQSFYFISFLKGKFGEDAFKGFLKEYSRHGNFSRAVRKTYFVSWDTIENQWLDYLTLRFSWIPIITSTGFIWFVASIIFILGYIRKKRKARIKMKQWETEEKYLFDNED
jgi:Peptidase MA superfamily